MNAYLRIATAAVALSLAACVTVPTGPSRMSLPGTGKTFDQFRFDDNDCRSYATAQIGGTTANQAAIDSGVASAAVGTAVGAVAGAAMGGSSGAGVGAGVGLVGGTLAGTGAAQSSSYTMQQRYDDAYMQCMYAKGHKVPITGRFTSADDRPRQITPPPPPPSATTPPAPPPGATTPPPPPPVR